MEALIVVNYECVGVVNYNGYFGFLIKRKKVCEEKKVMKMIIIRCNLGLFVGDALFSTKFPSLKLVFLSMKEKVLF
jgi:hypothetical protein